MSYALVATGGADFPNLGNRRIAAEPSTHIHPQEWDDATLAAAIAAGDAAAFDELYRRYRPLAFAVALGLLREPAAAEDAVHDAFLRFWRAARSFQPARGSLRSWLLTIVRNAAIDELRDRQMARRPDVDRAQREIHNRPGDDVAAAAVAHADAEQLHTALRALPQAQRQVLELAFFAGLTHGEIAACTGTPLGTVKGRVRLGLRRLRGELGGFAQASGANGPGQWQLA